MGGAAGIAGAPKRRKPIESRFYHGPPLADHRRIPVLREVSRQRSRQFSRSRRRTRRCRGRAAGADRPSRPPMLSRGRARSLRAILRRCRSPRNHRRNCARELRHVERHVDEADRALPREHHVFGRQRDWRIADRRSDRSGSSGTRSAGRDRTHDPRRDLVDFPALVAGTKTRNSSPPQRTIMSVSRSASRKRRATVTSTVSPAACP